MTELTEEEVQARLAGEATRGPRAFRGRPLAEWKRGLRDLRNKVLAGSDTPLFHDVALLFILSEAYTPPDASKEAQAEQRGKIIAATDDLPGFRARVSLLIDELSDDEAAEAKRLTDEILGVVSLATVAVAPEKKAEDDAGVAASTPTTTPSPSGPSPEPPAGPLST